ncbi:Oxidoreductase, molybdopterin-binding domain-containing protein [Paraphoma chrysanthemicola]|nr:Oxidoreductase, molybdopterin-binding domain-containing protein [Paraphoma chrysanthemicola]
MNSQIGSKRRSERDACLEVCSPSHSLQAPKPCVQSDYITQDGLLFEEYHMGVAVVDRARWKLVVDGLVDKPLVFSLQELECLPESSITAFHECYGSPLHPSQTNLWKIGNVVWSGVRLSTMLGMAGPSTSANFVWSEGLDYGVFAGNSVECYQKDLPIEKAMSDEVIIAYKMNNEPLRPERGGPVRLVVPGWFATNSTKWLSRLSVKSIRAPGIFASHFYNREDSASATGISPVWAVEPNSMIVHPAPGACLYGPAINIHGWAWGAVEIATVEIRLDDTSDWIFAEIYPRQGFSWQKYTVSVDVCSGKHFVSVRATSTAGEEQPLERGRNHVHTVRFEVS